MKRLLRTLLVATALSFPPAIVAKPLVGHVVVIGVDGLSPLGILNTDTPQINALVQRGAHTWHARGVMPTSSSPNGPR
ncbi:MAG: hypothetical protein EXS37_11650 [Opitutus sp.]|nr:hypothetical protein [Opitutus sp.]